jgi:hypothetical protein
MKKVLFLYYSQAGQTERAIKLLAKGFAQVGGCDVESYTVSEEFRFPWSMRSFFRAFPRCVLGLAPDLKRLPVDLEAYDLIVIGGQVWFLSPSLPLQSLLSSPQARQLKGKSVVTLVTCRNLWYSASRIIQGALETLGAKFLGQVTICEISPIWASFVTTPRWMLTGKKNPFLFFPPAGIREQDFAALEARGRELGEAWIRFGGEGLHSRFGSNLDRLSLRLMDRIGRSFFEVWSRVIMGLCPKPGLAQDLILVLFRINLVALIVVLAPCTKLVEWMIADRGGNFGRQRSSEA